MSDVSEENQVVVNIYGEEYPITGSEDSGYIARIADLVDSRMREIAATSRCKSKDKLAILAALSFASELFEKNEDLSGIERQVSSRIDDIVTSLEKTLGDIPSGQN
jgi:cell division protein ZapA